MMTTLRIDNFRSFRKLIVEGLTRVSLLVGANNAGKTSVLEAAALVLGGKAPPFSNAVRVAAAIRPADKASKVRFMETASPPVSELRLLWDAVVLTPDEAKVTSALQIIEPDIERLAALSGTGLPMGGGMFVRLRGSDERIPLGSMGEGIKRLLALSLNLVSSAGGYLLVDEIDTGLHHSVMTQMWRLVVEVARRLDVQVLATTHSLDCVRSLAALYEESPGVRELISLHRIERGAEASVPYSADEILAASQHQMELR
ncbi:MAG TPA: AAA family ATPase [Archangium sp.]|nr:AAA family ATPase [Archangium sp.]